MFENKIVFVSNFMNHHQKPLCDSLYEIYGDNFVFIQMEKLPDERMKMKYQQIKTSYIFDLSNGLDLFILEDVAKTSRVLICSLEFKSIILERKKTNLLTFTYCERLFKSKLSYLKYFHFVRLYKKIDFKNNYLLCAGSYVYKDFAKFRCFKNRALQWGYFPEFIDYSNLDEIIANKKCDSIFWCGRFLDWKRAKDVVLACNYLKKCGYYPEVTLVGDGPEKKKVEAIARQHKLDNIVFLDPITPQEIRRLMLKHKIFVVSSTRKEGWGAVLNEAMNSCCISIANSQIGSAPSILEDGKNGFLYKCKNARSLSKTLLKALGNNNLNHDIEKKSFYTIKNCWNAKLAADRLSRFIEKKEIPLSGPCSLVK